MIISGQIDVARSMKLVSMRSLSQPKTSIEPSSHRDAPVPSGGEEKVGERYDDQR